MKNDSTFASRSDRDVQRFGQIKKSLNFICLERKNITIFATPFRKLRSAKNKQTFKKAELNFLKLNLVLSKTSCSFAPRFGRNKEKKQ
jgi:hypothetical protein